MNGIFILFIFTFFTHHKVIAGIRRIGCSDEMMFDAIG